MEKNGRIQHLIEAALEAREHSYAPYSRFHVGAALLTSEGRVYQGCNIENASYTPTICAERNAFFKAVYEGERDFAMIAIAGSPEGPCTDYAAPCGVCRQVMMEFCDPKAFRVIIAKSPEEYLEYRLEELLPLGFGPANLKG